MCASVAYNLTGVSATCTVLPPRLPQVDVVEVRQQHQENLSGVLSAVQDALASGTAAAAAAPAAGKRKPPLPPAGGKKRRIDPLAALDELSSDEEEEEKEEESNEESDAQVASGDTAGAGLTSGKDESAEAAQANQPAAASGGSDKSSSEGFEAAGDRSAEGSPATAEQPAQGAAPAGADAVTDATAAAAAAETGAQQAQQAKEQTPHEPVDLSAFGTPEELEAAVGGDRLKAELQVRLHQWRAAWAAAGAVRAWHAPFLVGQLLALKLLLRGVHLVRIDTLWSLSSFLLS